MILRAIAILAVLVATACTGAEPVFRPAELVVNPEAPVAEERDVAHESPPSGPLLTVLVSPTDLTTAFRGVPEVVVAGEMLEEDIREVIDAVDLLTWPDGVPVRATVEYVAPMPEATVPEHRFLVRPATDLASGWYALEVQPLSAGRFLVASARDAAPSRARFRVGSGPVVRGVSFSPGDTEVGVSLSLSERIVDERLVADLVTVEVDDAALSCQTRGAEYLGELGRDSIEVVCPRFDLEANVTIRLNGELLTSIGTALEVPFGSSRTELTVNPVRGGLVLDEVALLASRPAPSHDRPRR